MLDHECETPLEGSMNRWKRIRKTFLSSITRFIPRMEAYDIFNILERYELALLEIAQKTYNSPEMEDIHKIAEQALEDCSK
jgi:hypothetical protein